MGHVTLTTPLLWVSGLSHGVVSVIL